MKNAGSLPQEESTFGKGIKDIPQRNKGRSGREERSFHRRIKDIRQRNEGRPTKEQKAFRKKREDISWQMIMISLTIQTCDSFKSNVQIG